MPVTEYLERNARLYPDEVALVELNPDEPDTRRTSWKEFELIQPSRFEPYRREITWTLVFIKIILDKCFKSVCWIIS